MIRDVVRGAMSIPRATRLILTDRTLFLLSMIPIALSAALYALFFNWALTLIHSKLLGLSLFGSGLLNDALGILATLLLFIVMSAVVFFTLVFTTGLLASPFADWLAERTEILQGHSVSLPFSVKRIVRVFVIDLKKAFFIGAVGAVLSVMAFFPVLTPIWGLATPLLVALQFVVYPLSRREKGLKETFAWMGRNLPACFGYGVVVGLGFGIPIVSLVLIPTAVVAGTLLYCEGK
jgi:CysZ protein